MPALRQVFTGGASVGRAVHDIEVKIIDNHQGEAFAALSVSAFAELEKQPGVAGEIVVAGAHVIESEAGVASASSDKISVGSRVWHRTGDAGYLDHDGVLWIVGRARHRLGAPGHDLYPLQVEGLLSDLLKQDDYAVVRFGTELIVACAGKVGAGRALVERRLRPFGKFRVLEGIGRIPRERRHNAKVDVTRLKRLLAPTLRT